MRVKTERFAAAVRYLTEIGLSQSTVLFSPKGGNVVVSINTNDIYAEYLVEPQEPLRNRFAVRAGPIKRIASEIEEGGLIEYQEGSTAVFTSDAANKQASWWLPFVDLRTIQPQEAVSPNEWIEMDSAMRKGLEFIAKSTVDPSRTRVNNSLDCVLIQCEEKDNYRKMVASDRNTMAVWWEEVAVPGDAYLLIERRHIPKILDTCVSGSRIMIGIGLQKYFVQCGRRCATFGRRRQVFPKEWSKIFQSHRSASGKSITVYKDRLRSLSRQVAEASDPVEIRQKGKVTTIACALESIETEAELETTSASDGFGQVIVSGRYIHRLADHWPEETMRMSHAGASRPLVVTSEQLPLSVLINQMENDSTGAIDKGSVEHGQNQETLAGV